jgi:hypothetical protein
VASKLGKNTSLQSVRPLGIASFSRSKPLWHPCEWWSDMLEALEIDMYPSGESRSIPADFSRILTSTHSEYGWAENRLIATCSSPRHRRQINHSFIQIFP